MIHADASRVEAMKRVRALLLAGKEAPLSAPIDADYFANLRLRAISGASCVLKTST